MTIMDSIEKAQKFILEIIRRKPFATSFFVYCTSSINIAWSIYLAYINLFSKTDKLKYHLQKDQGHVKINLRIFV